MENNEIKKALYKQSPVASLDRVRKGVAYYITQIKDVDSNKHISFEIPVEDMGDADFFVKMEAKHLIRWLA